MRRAASSRLASSSQVLPLTPRCDPPQASAHLPPPVLPVQTNSAAPTERGGLHSPPPTSLSPLEPCHQIRPF